MITTPQFMDRKMTLPSDSTSFRDQGLCEATSELAIGNRFGYGLYSCTLESMFPLSRWGISD
jgi:hypothetical protein